MPDRKLVLGRGWAERLVLAGVCAVAWARVWLIIDSRWVPTDDGILGLTALRVLQGELPHRDFDDVYTGGLALWHALVFRICGVRLVSLRYAVFAVFVPWVPTLWWITRRAVSRLAAAGCVALAVEWSLPTYAAAMPSWYCLFAATFAVAALMRHGDTGRMRWLVVAGVCAGLACTLKITGLYILAGAFIFLLGQAARAPTPGAGRPTPDAGASPPRARTLFPWLATLASCGLVAVVIRMLRGRSGPSDVVHFVLPATALGGLAAWEAWRCSAATSRARTLRLATTLAAVCAGFVLPIIAFLAPYAARGGVRDVLVGVFEVPFRRLDSLAQPLPALATSVWLIPFAVLLVLPLPVARWLRAVVVAVAAIVFLSGPTAVDVAREFGLAHVALRHLIPLVMLGGVWLLRPTNAPATSTATPATDFPARWSDAWCLLCILGLTSLVQFPFAGAPYFFYCAALAPPAAAAWTALRPRTARWVVGPVAALLLALAPTMYLGAEQLAERWGATESKLLDVPRGGIHVAPRQADGAALLVATVREHAHGRYIWAGPEAAEVYFLTGFDNPTGTLYMELSERGDSYDKVINTIDELGIDCVVVRTDARWVAGLPRQWWDALAQRFPHREQIGLFLVGWK